MKKTILILSILILTLTINKYEKYTIPNESIRFRVIANSDNKKDQELKKEIVSKLKSNLIYTNKFTNISTTRNYIQENLPTFENIIKTTTDNYTINYGDNYFPKKEYDNVTYPEGQYESLVITLGEGKGENFWCVLFPPLCFDEEDHHEYKSFIKEIFDKIFE